MRENDFPLQQFKGGIRASYRPHDSTTRLFDQCHEFQRYEQVIFNNENGREREQLRTPCDYRTGQASQ
jgi:hypothetical protein